MPPLSDACERNKEPILAVLRGALAGRTQVLEIGSGTGQHAVHFSAGLPHLVWHPTEQLTHLAVLTRRIEREGGANLRAPRVLDVRQAVWPLHADAVFTANTLHILSWTGVIALFAGVDASLARRGTLCLYGPFRHAGGYTSPSNAAFDRMLRERDPLSGLRDFEAVRDLARGIGLGLTADHEMPAFNRLLVFERP